MALTITALTDVIELPAPESGVQGDYQTFGYWPAVGVVVGEVGFFGYINPTNFGAAAVQWDPGNDATDGVVLATAPAKRRWLLEGTGPDLLLVGWTDELLMDPEPFVMEMPVSRLTPEGGVVVAAGDAELVSHTPVVIVPDGEGSVVAAGEAELVAHLPVVIAPDGEGEVVTAGEVRLTVAGHLAPDDPGAVVTAGELTSGGLVVQVYPEGLGGLVELELTPGDWPGAARVGAVPKAFDRMNNRTYSGTLPGAGRPAWYVPPDETNPLAQYVTFWSWMSEYPVSPLYANGYYYYNPLYDSSGNENHIALESRPDFYLCTVVDAPSGYNGAYEPVIDSSTGWLLYYEGPGGIGRLVPHEEPVGYWPSWDLTDSDGNVVEAGIAGSYQFRTFPWNITWPTITVTTEYAVGSSHWGQTGLVNLGSDNASQWGGMEAMVDSAFTVLLDVTPWLADHPREMSSDDALLFRLNASDGSLYLHQSYPGEAWGTALIRNDSLDYREFDVFMEFGTRERLIVSVDMGGDVSLYCNGVQFGPFEIGGWNTPAMTAGPFNLQLLALGWPNAMDPFLGVMHEVGFLSGYAATAADVATNLMFTTPYGLAGSFFPSSDAPVS